MNANNVRMNAQRTYAYGLFKHISWGFVSYYFQVKEVLNFHPETVLEIGVGKKIFYNLLKDLGVRIISLDLDRTSKPNIVGTVVNLPIKDETVDVVGCFEVLEHLPFSRFANSLAEIYRIAKIGAVISVPDINWFLDFRVAIPKLHFRRVITIPRLKRKRAPISLPISGHYWHIGNVGFPRKRIVSAIRESGFILHKEFRVPGFPGHHFFVLRK